MTTSPETAIILGTGLGQLASEITDTYELPYAEIPNFPVSTVEGHSGKLIFGRLGGKDIIAMQGPFSADMNKALINECGAKVILTKESGRNGGYYEKLEAAGECDIKAVVVRNPERLVDETNHLGMRQVLKKLTTDYHLNCFKEDDSVLKEAAGADTEKVQKIELWK